MAESLAYQLCGKGMVTDSLTLAVGYDRKTATTALRGEIHIDHYGRKVPKGAHGTVRLDSPTNLASQLGQACAGLFDRIVSPDLLVRRITITAGRVVKDEGFWQYDLFTDTKQLEKEKRLQDAMLGIKRKFGKMLC